MMKNISKLAALAVATAFLLAGFPACSGDDDGDPTLTKIEVKADNVKTDYKVGDKFNTTGITITATYSDGSKPDVTADATVVAKIGDTEDPTLTKEDSEVTIIAKYGEMESAPVTIEITVTDGDEGGDDDPNKPGDDATLDSIEIAIAATLKTEYTVGEEFDKTGITVTATYSNGDTKDETANATITAKVGDAEISALEQGDYDVTITATYEGKTATATCTITVKADDGEQGEKPTLTNIAVTFANTMKTEYKADEKFDKTGITVTATYSDNTTKDVTANASIAVTYKDAEFTTTTAGTYEVTFTATYGEKTATATHTITVKDDGGKPTETPTLDSIEIAIADTLKTEYKVGDAFDKTGITVTATYSDGDTKDVTTSATITAKAGDADFTTATAGTYEVTFTATYEEKTATATCTITVKVNGTTYAWNFQAAGLKTILSYSPSTEEATLGKDQLDAEGTYESTPAGLTLVLPKGAAFNKIDTAMSASNASSVGASTGAIEPHATADITVNVRGPFTATMICGSNSSSAKTDRYAYIKVNGTEVAAPGKANTSLDVGETLSYTYTETDEVTVAFGVSANYVRIYDIKIITENGDDTGKTAGEVKSKAEFVPDTNDSTTNDVATLGLAGTDAISSDSDVAVAEITDDGKIVIKSVSKAGTATITVTDGTEGHEAIIAVSVSGTGKITIEKITPYIDLASIFTVTDGVLELKAAKYEYYLSAENLNDPTGNNAWSAKTAGNETTSKKSIAPFADSITVLNMSKSDRYITLKVKGVAAFDVYIQKDAKNTRTYTVSINEANTQEGSCQNDFDTFTTGTADETTIKIAGNNGSVYPVGVILYKEVPATE